MILEEGPKCGNWRLSFHQSGRVLIPLGTPKQSSFLPITTSFVETTEMAKQSLLSTDSFFIMRLSVDKSINNTHFQESARTYLPYHCWISLTLQNDKKCWISLILIVFQTVHYLWKKAFFCVTRQTSPVFNARTILKSIGSF